MKIITKILLTALTLLFVAKYVPGITVDGFYPAVIAAIILGLLNVFVRPVLLILTFPITLVTVGLFVLIINAALFWFAASFVSGFAVASFGYAFLGSLVVTIVSTLMNRFF